MIEMRPDPQIKGPGETLSALQLELTGDTALTENSWWASLSLVYLLILSYCPMLSAIIELLQYRSC